MGWVDLGGPVARINSASVTIVGTRSGGEILMDCGYYGGGTVHCDALISVSFPPAPADFYDVPPGTGPHALLSSFGTTPMESDSDTPWECLADGTSGVAIQVDPCWLHCPMLCHCDTLTPSVLSVTEAYLTIDFDALVPTEAQSWGCIKGLYR